MDPISRTVSALREQATPGSCTPKKAERHSRSNIGQTIHSSNQKRLGTQNNTSVGVNDCLIYHFEEECIATPIKQFSNSFASPELERKTNTSSIYTPSSLQKLTSSYRCSSPRIRTPQYTPAPSTGPPNTYERAICQQFDEDYNKAFLEQEIGYKARLGSVRNITGSTLGLFTVYLIIGCLYYSKWSSEAQWPLEESLVFLIYTVTTVGYGNHTIPTSPASRVFLIFYILIGIALVTVVFSEAFQYLVLEAARAKYLHDEERFKRNIANTDMSNRSGDDARVDKQRSNNHNLLRRKGSLIRSLFFETYDKIKDWMKYTKIGQCFMVTLPFAGLILTGATVVGSLEGWSAIDSVYWAVVTLTTVGYGDLTPSKPSSIWFCIFYLPTATIFLSLFLSKIASIYLRLHVVQIAKIEGRLAQKLEPKDIEKAQGINMVISEETGETSPESKASSGSGSSGSLEHSLLSKDSSIERQHMDMSMMSMRDMLKAAKKSAIDDFPQDNDVKVLNVLREDAPPPISLRARVQERLVFIIATSLCNKKPIVEVKDGVLNATLDWSCINEWMIPKKAKECFKTTSFEVLLCIGFSGIQSEGVDALLEMPPAEFQELFNPLIATMGSADCLKGWLQRTDALMKEIRT